MHKFNQNIQRYVAILTSNIQQEASFYFIIFSDKNELQ